jgi:hypothetical protein
MNAHRLAIVMCLALFGCGRSHTDWTLDTQQAHANMIAFLETWKAGRTTDQLQELNPAIVGNDEDWAAGRKLVSYQLAGEPFHDGSNLHFKTVLKLRASGKHRGPAHKIQAIYTVGTSPVSTVFRQ